VSSWQSISGRPSHEYITESLYHKRLPWILTIVQLLNVLLGSGICLHSLKALSDVVERLALYPPYHGCHSRVVCNPLF